LQDLGVSANVRVGIHSSRSVEMIVGILAILKAGGAYVPLDPSYPRERLELVLQDADPAVLLVHGDVDLDPSATRAVQVRLDRDVDVSEPIGSRRDASVTPNDLAYVIYTSGSNGRPNGVMVTHRNLVQSTAARQHFYGESPESFLLLSSLSFDSSVAGIFWTLTSGGHLVIPGDVERFDVRDVCRLIQHERVSHLLCIPSVYDTLLREAQPYNLDRLRTVIVAGEPCRPSLVERHHWLGWNVRLVNEYGPTEATVWSCAYDCKKNDERARVPIGRPIANTQAFILDAHLQPLPIGVPGELCIGGAGVARGYLGRRDLTDTRFIPHPFDDSPGARLYRTGDLARYLTDGNIELVGRVDDQVKIRGCRLELGDVTAALESHPAVREASAAVRETPTGDIQLLGFIVEAQPVSDAELLSHARGRLPEFGVPAEIVRVDRLPRLPNGKLDRHALVGAAGATSVPKERAPGRPWTDLESQIRGIWRDVLGKDVGRQTDNFFQIGGDSLSVIRVHNRLRSMTDRDVAITDLFKAPTIELQAALVAASAVSGEV
jgi:amino acid adenylation domain-containing protein